MQKQSIVIYPIILIFILLLNSTSYSFAKGVDNTLQTQSINNQLTKSKSENFSGPGGVRNPEIDTKSGHVNLNIPIASISNGESLSLNYSSNTLNYSQIWNDEIQSSEVGFGWMLKGAHQKSFKRISLGSGDEKIHRFIFDSELLEEIKTNAVGVRVFQLEHSHNLNKFYLYDTKDKPSYWIIYDTKGNKLHYGGDPVSPIDIKSEQNSAVKQACSILTHFGNKAISNCYSGSTEYGVKWGDWTGAMSSLKYQGHSQEQLATAWNLSFIEDKWGNKTQYKYVQQMQNVGNDKEAKYFSISSFLYEISTPDKQSIQIWYCSRSGSSMLSSNNEHSWGSNLCNNIKGKRFADFTDSWIQNIEPDSYQEKYSTLYLGGVGTFTNGDNESTIYSLAEPHYKYDAPGDDASMSKLMLTNLSLYEVNSKFVHLKIQPDYNFDYYGEADGLLITRSGSSQDGIDNQKIYNKDTGAVYGMIKSYLSPLGKKTTYKYKKNILKNINRSLKVAHGANRLIAYNNNELAISSDNSLTTYRWTPSGWKTGSKKISSEYGNDNERFVENVVFSKHGLFIKNSSTGELIFRKRKVLLEKSNDFWEDPITVYSKGVIGFSTIDNSLILSAADGIHIYKYVSDEFTTKYHHHWKQIGDVIKYQKIWRTESATATTASVTADSATATTASVTATSGHLAYAEFVDLNNDYTALVTVIDVDFQGNYIKKYTTISASLADNSYINGVRLSFPKGIAHESIYEIEVLRYNTDKKIYGSSTGVRIHAYKNMFYVNYPLAIVDLVDYPTASTTFPIQGNRILGLRFNSDRSGLQVDQGGLNRSDAFDGRNFIITGDNCPHESGIGDMRWHWSASSSITDWGLNHSTTATCIPSSGSNVALSVCSFNGSKVYSGPFKYEGLEGCGIGSLSGTGLPSSKVASSQNGLGNSIFYYFDPKIQKWENVGNQPYGSFSEPVKNTNKTGNILGIIALVFGIIMIAVSIILIPFTGGVSAAVLTLVPLVISLGLTMAISYFPDTVKNVNSLDPAGTSLTQRYINDNRTLWFVNHSGDFSPLGADTEHDVSVLKGIGGELISLAPSVGAGFVPFTAKDGKSGKWTSYIRILRNGKLGKYVPVLSYASYEDKPYVMWDKKDAFASSTNSMFISYQQNTENNFLKSTGDIYIHKVLQESAMGSMSDYAVSSVIVDDGISLHTTDYEYADNAAHVQSTIYSNVTIYPGGKDSKNGFLKHYYYIGDETVTGPDLSPMSSEVLVGKRYKSEIYKYGNKSPISSIQIKYRVNYTRDKLSLNISSITKKIDGVKSTIDYSYHQKSRQLIKKSVSKHRYGMNDSSRVISMNTLRTKQDVTEYKYAWEYDNDVLNKNYYDLLQFTKKYSLLNGRSSSTPAKYNFNIYKDWGNSTYGKKCSYFSTTNTQQINPNEKDCPAPALKLTKNLQWQRGSVILSRNKDGGVTQSKDSQLNIYNTIRYIKNNDSYYPISNFVNKDNVSNDGKNYGLNMYFGAEHYEDIVQAGIELSNVEATQESSFSGKSSLLFQNSGNISYSYKPENKKPSVISFWLKLKQKQDSCKFDSDISQLIKLPEYNKWKYFEYISNGETIEFNLSCSSGSQIDDIAVHPVDAKFNANIYDNNNMLLLNTIANSGLNNHYKYDNFLRLSTSYSNSNGDDDNIMIKNDLMKGFSRWGGSGRESDNGKEFNLSTPNTLFFIDISRDEDAKYLNNSSSIANIGNSFYLKLLIDGMQQKYDDNFISIGDNKIKLSIDMDNNNITLNTSSGISKTYKIDFRLNNIAIAYIKDSLFIWASNKLLGSFSGVDNIDGTESINTNIYNKGIIFAKNPRIYVSYKDALGRTIQSQYLSKVNGKISSIAIANVYDGWGNIAIKTKVSAPNIDANSQCSNYNKDFAFLNYCSDLIDSINWSEFKAKGISGAEKKYWDNQTEFTEFNKKSDSAFSFISKSYTNSPLNRIESSSKTYGELFSENGKLGTNKILYNDSEAKNLLGNMTQRKASDFSQINSSKHTTSFNDSSSSKLLSLKESSGSFGFSAYVDPVSSSNDILDKNNIISVKTAQLNFQNNNLNDNQVYADKELKSYSPNSWTILDSMSPIYPIKKYSDRIKIKPIDWINTMYVTNDDGHLLVKDSSKVQQQCLLFSRANNKDKMSIEDCSNGMILESVGVKEGFIDRLSVYADSRVLSYKESDSKGESYTFKDALGRVRFTCNNYLKDEALSNGCYYKKYDYKGRIVETGVLKGEHGDMDYYLSKTNDNSYPSKEQSCPASYRFYDYAFDIDKAYNNKDNSFNPTALSMKNMSNNLFAIAKVNANIPEKPTDNCGSSGKDVVVNYFWNNGNQWDGINIYGSARYDVGSAKFKYRNTSYNASLNTHKIIYPDTDTNQFEIKDKQKRVLKLYDEFGILNKICEGNSSDNNCTPNKTYADQHKYYINGLLKSYLINNGKLKQEYIYDTLFRLREIKTTEVQNNKIIFKENIEYESDNTGKGYQGGNIISSKYDGSGLKAFNKDLSHQYDYDYDIFNRLTNAKKSNLKSQIMQKEFSYEYDNNGNIIKRSIINSDKTSSNYDYLYKHESNRLQQVSNKTTKENITYQYIGPDDTIGAVSKISRDNQPDINFIRDAHSGKALQVNSRKDKKTYSINYIFDALDRRINQRSDTR